MQFLKTIYVGFFSSDIHLVNSTLEVQRARELKTAESHFLDCFTRYGPSCHVLNLIRQVLSCGPLQCLCFSGTQVYEFV